MKEPLCNSYLILRLEIRTFSIFLVKKLVVDRRILLLDGISSCFNSLSEQFLCSILLLGLLCSSFVVDADSDRSSIENTEENQNSIDQKLKIPFLYIKFLFLSRVHQNLVAMMQSFQQLEIVYIELMYLTYE